ncbi:hypothetical protein GUJ93_ZPchr0012g19389 [Zizania palustris]|uniref:Uncharacterized protein n=1 Tax=Zizania palustris TaxID=103762 RepID=A0A8J6BPW4_ZIZPA|nr:hypothetical protein GUJ93_ZPchr0012g19389 [Zizania palustris]
MQARHGAGARSAMAYIGTVQWEKERKSIYRSKEEKKRWNGVGSRGRVRISCVLSIFVLARRTFCRLIPACIHSPYLPPGAGRDVDRELPELHVPADQGSGRGDCR